MTAFSDAAKEFQNLLMRVEQLEAFARARLQADVPRVAWSPKEFGEALGMSRDSVYRALDKGEISSFRIRGEHRIPHSELERLFAAAQRRSA